MDAAELRNVAEMPGGRLVDYSGGEAPGNTATHSSDADYVRRIWGQYFRVAEIVPGRRKLLQTAVVIRAL